MTGPSSPADLVMSANTTNSLIHLYRGEVGRMTAYRVRLDLTTNWAVITTAGLVGYAFSPQGFHAVMIAAMVANYFFLHVEARRFRAFEVSHLRVRILERFFWREALGEAEANGDWRPYLIADLAKSHLPLDRLQAIGWRLRHNYLWIYAADLIAWVTKLNASQSPSDQGWGAFVNAAAIETIPGWAVMSFVGALYAALLVLAWRAPSYPLEMD
ncbi:DUF2270 domain-containing protein [Deinococcus pimensis]|uniref:DUF2270 domain-containing protein n=1 Tax=Deinococcus pimensis TaxID=309888 RepID=UPI000486F0F2|nr:DUF2270 domain-containing protein [Deinococcus pimensis]